ncbi:DUF600 family protein [Periweissella cryptocerci]|uniref:DUF600 family protein n=1 Tax=Periweissella cryptocerci TaxID=2506420 RepID=A0A4P6YSW0_9LACO|nr:DUF600 family protein [Periweissella cryptocerci]
MITMLENELAPLYNELGNEVIMTIPKDWTEVHYLGEVESKERSTASIFYFKEKMRIIILFVQTIFLIFITFRRRNMITL